MDHSTVIEPALVEEVVVEPEAGLRRLSSLTGIPFRVRPKLDSPVTSEEDEKTPPVPKEEPKKEGKPESSSEEKPIEESTKEEAPKPKAKPKKAPSYNAWKAGTGFGHTLDCDDWDIHEWSQSAAKSDDEILKILEVVLCTLRDNKKDNKIDIKSLVLDSCVLPFLKEYLSNDSLLDMVQNHSQLYTRILEFIGEITKHCDLLSMFFDRCHAPRTNRALYHILEDLADKCSVAYQFGGDLMKPDDAGEKEASAATAPMAPPPPPPSPKKRKRKAKPVVKVDVDVKLPKLIIDTFALVKAAIAKKDSVANAEEKKSEDVDDRRSYIKFMGKNGFSATTDEGFLKTHNYQSQSSESTKKQIIRLGCEFANLVKSLPIEWESSVLLCVDENKMQYGKFMIIPPDDTPYASGCFIFDVYFPKTYPSVPPKVNLMTTGQGSVRFNPNLYNCGKVCLSLLGTWGGQTQGEQWQPKISTFLQVLVSIQSLVFVPQPYYNEPSYEREMNTPAGDTKSERYSKNIRTQTTRWAMIDILKNPPKCFEKQIKYHFTTQRDRVLKNAEAWLGTDHEMVKELKELLDKLQAESKKPETK